MARHCSAAVIAGDQPPTVSLTAPANAATFAAPASITITANAADPENQLTRVDFYNGSTLLGSVPAGTYSLSAIARDAAGVEVFAAAADPNTATAIATTDVGNPTPDANNDTYVSIPSFFSALAPGNYQLTVAAVSGTQFTRSSPPLTFTK